MDFDDLAGFADMDRLVGDDGADADGDELDVAELLLDTFVCLWSIDADQLWRHLVFRLVVAGIALCL